MMMESLSGAITKARDTYRWKALQDAKQYDEAFKQTGDRSYSELAHVCRRLAVGKNLISINRAMQIGGVMPGGHPALAVANAAAKWVWFCYDGPRRTDSDKEWTHDTVAFASDYAIHPKVNWVGTDGRRKRDFFHFKRELFPIRTNTLRAQVPLVPPKHLPKQPLENFVILWEANWTEVPKDPLLLKRVTREWYEIVAAWDLTELERLVMNSATFRIDK